MRKRLTIINRAIACLAASALFLSAPVVVAFAEETAIPEAEFKHEMPPVPSSFVSPYPPDWLSEEDYITFPNWTAYDEWRVNDDLGKYYDGYSTCFNATTAYATENWAKILRLRELAEMDRRNVTSKTHPNLTQMERNDLDAERAILRAEWSELTRGFMNYNRWFKDPGLNYEVRLCELRSQHLYDFSSSTSLMTYVWNQDTREDIGSELDLKLARLDFNTYLDRHWRGKEYKPADERSLILWILTRMAYDKNFDRKAFLDRPSFDIYRDEDYFKELYALTIVHIDGSLVWLDYLRNNLPTARITNGTAYVSLETFEAIGAECTYSQRTGKITLTRAEKRVVMKRDSSEAAVNGQTTDIKAAPFESDGKILVPMRFVAETFSQRVSYNHKTGIVNMENDKGFLKENDDIESWFFGACAILAYENRPPASGGWRTPARTIDLDDRPAFWAADQFRTRPWIGMLPREKYNIDNVLEALNEQWGCYDRKDVIETVKSLAKGDDSWDLFRAFHVAGWGYLVGWLELPEACDLARPAAKALKSTYSSWEEASTAYLESYGRFVGMTDEEIKAFDRETYDYAVYNSPPYKYASRQYCYIAAKEEDDGTLFNPDVWK